MQHRGPRLLPFLAAGAGIATFSAMDALMKHASVIGGAYNAMLWRSLIGTALALPLWLAMRTGLPDGRRLRIHVLRSAVVAAMAVLFFWGLVRTPMAEAIALSFISPIIAILLAAAFLGERIQRGAVTATVLGLAGVGVIAAGQFGGSPRGHGTPEGIAAVLASAVLYAVNLVLQRRQAQLASPSEIVFFQNALVAAFLAFAAPWLAYVPSAAVLQTTAAGAALAIVSLLMLSWAYARAETQALVPVEYSAFLWAALMGKLFFDEPLAASTLAGAALIVLACWLAARVRTEQTGL